MFGDFRIVISDDLGELGSDDEPIVYYWSPLNSIIGYLPWLLVILAAVMIKANRNARVLWLLPALFVTYSAMQILAFATDMGDSAMILEVLVVSTICGISVWMLLAEFVSKFNWLIGLVITVMIFAVVGAAGIVPFQFEQRGLLALLYGVVVGVIILLMLFNRLICFRKYRPVLFGFMSILTTLIASIILAAVLAVILGAVEGGSITFGDFLMQGVVIGYIGGFCLLLPFEILLLTNKFWNNRFKMVFYPKLLTQSVDSELVDIENAGESE